jgi:hypothetical protein
LEGSQLELLREMQAWRDDLRSASRAEVSAVLVATAFAAKILKSTTLALQPFPEDFLHGRQLAEGREAQIRLASYLDQVNRLRANLEHSPHPLARLAMPGFQILVLSLGAVIHHRHVFSEGQMLWRELVRGVADYPKVYRILLNPRCSADEVADDLFVPTALIGARGIEAAGERTVDKMKANAERSFRFSSRHDTADGRRAIR